MLLLVLAACGSAELYTGLTEKEANEFVVRLNAAGIEASKAKFGEEGKEKFSISVPSDKLEAAFNVLNLYGLPRPSGHGIAAVYPGGGLVPGQFEEKAKYLLALTGEIEMTLMTIDRVVEARVHVVLPEESVLKDEDEGTVRPTASVLIKYIPTENKETPIKETDVKALVSRSIEGLNSQDVTVVMVEASMPTGMPVSQTPGDTPTGTAPGTMSPEQCLDKYGKKELQDKAEIAYLGPIGVLKSSQKMFMIVVVGLAGLMVLFLVTTIVGFAMASGAKKRLSAATKTSKVKKPNAAP